VHAQVAGGGVSARLFAASGKRAKPFFGFARFFMRLRGGVYSFLGFSISFYYPRCCLYGFYFLILYRKNGHQAYKTNILMF
jgi:hypothetical protein